MLLVPPTCSSCGNDVGSIILLYNVLRAQKLASYYNTGLMRSQRLTVDTEDIFQSLGLDERRTCCRGEIEGIQLPSEFDEFNIQLPTKNN